MSAIFLKKKTIPWAQEILHPTSSLWLFLKRKQIITNMSVMKYVGLNISEKYFYFNSLGNICTIFLFASQSHSDMHKDQYDSL